jgi:hypothetical protein
MRKTLPALALATLRRPLLVACPVAAAPLAVPKAAEHADDEVTFGEAVGAPPKPRRSSPRSRRTRDRQGRRATRGKEAGQPGRRPDQRSRQEPLHPRWPRLRQPTKAAEKESPKARQGRNSHERRRRYQVDRLFCFLIVSAAGVSRWTTRSFVDRFWLLLTAPVGSAQMPRIELSRRFLPDRRRGGCQRPGSRTGSDASPHHADQPGDAVRLLAGGPPLHVDAQHVSAAVGRLS